MLGNLGGRGDRIVAHHMVIDLFGGVGRQLVSALKEHALFHSHTKPPSTRFSSRYASLVIQELGPAASNSSARRSDPCCARNTSSPDAPAPCPPPGRLVGHTVHAPQAALAVVVIEPRVHHGLAALILAGSLNWNTISGQVVSHKPQLIHFSGIKSGI